MTTLTDAQTDFLESIRDSLPGTILDTLKENNLIGAFVYEGLRGQIDGQEMVLEESTGHVKILDNDSVSWKGMVVIHAKEFEAVWNDLVRYPDRDSILKAFKISDEAISPQTRKGGQKDYKGGQRNAVDSLASAFGKLIYNDPTYFGNISQRDDKVKNIKFQKSLKSDEQVISGELMRPGRDPAYRPRPSFEDDIRYGTGVRSPAIRNINNELAEIFSGEFYEDYSRIPKTKVRGFLSFKEKEVETIKASGRRGLFQRWQKHFICGFAMTNRSGLVYEVWFNTIDSTFTLYDVRGVDVTRMRYPTLQEAMRALFDQIVVLGSSDELVSRSTREFDSILRSVGAGMYKHASRYLDIQQTVERDAANEVYRIQKNGNWNVAEMRNMDEMYPPEVVSPKERTEAAKGYQNVFQSIENHIGTANTGLRDRLRAMMMGRLVKTFENDVRLMLRKEGLDNIADKVSRSAGKEKKSRETWESSAHFASKERPLSETDAKREVMKVFSDLMTKSELSRTVGLPGDFIQSIESELSGDKKKDMALFIRVVDYILERAMTLPGLGELASKKTQNIKRDIHTKIESLRTKKDYTTNELKDLSRVILADFHRINDLTRMPDEDVQKYIEDAVVFLKNIIMDTGMGSPKILPFGDVYEPARVESLIAKYRENDVPFVETARKIIERQIVGFEKAHESILLTNDKIRDTILSFRNDVSNLSRDFVRTQADSTISAWTKTKSNKEFIADLKNLTSNKKLRDAIAEIEALARAEQNSKENRAATRRVRVVPATEAERIEIIEMAFRKTLHHGLPNHTFYSRDGKEWTTIESDLPEGDIFVTTKTAKNERVLSGFFYADSVYHGEVLTPLATSTLHAISPGLGTQMLAFFQSPEPRAMYQELFNFFKDKLSFTGYIKDTRRHPSGKTRIVFRPFETSSSSQDSLDYEIMEASKRSKARPAIPVGESILDMDFSEILRETREEYLQERQEQKIPSKTPSEIFLEAIDHIGRAAMGPDPDEPEVPFGELLEKASAQLERDHSRNAVSWIRSEWEEAISGSRSRSVGTVDEIIAAIESGRIHPYSQTKIRPEGFFEKWTPYYTRWARMFLDNFRTYPDMYGTVYGPGIRASFVMGFQAGGGVSLEVWYVTEPDPMIIEQTMTTGQRIVKNIKKWLFGKEVLISSFYVMDVTSGSVIKKYLPYQRNALQFVARKLSIATPEALSRAPFG